MKHEFRHPTVSQRTVIVGRTGSGKTRCGSWLLSEQPYTKMPYVILNFKGEPLFNGIDQLQEIGFNDIPKRPGLYQLSPLPSEEAQTEEWLYRVWERGRTGLYFDETLQVPGHHKNGAFKAILTQGRSKHIPCILCTQRPSGISTSVFSEADNFAIFHLNRRADTVRLRESGLPDNVDLEAVLPPYHWRWYDVNRDALFKLGPVPDDKAILARFNDRLRPKSRWL